ncbi:hypothetical protein FRB95_010498 [Tulasnella sp. JGI-2019a]|nr:hypothetical protein FRB95_010498 [Tulasnella sp. JGI-2019a]
MYSDLEVYWTRIKNPVTKRYPTRTKTLIPARGERHPSRYRNSQGENVEVDLNPPELSVVTNALASLINSVKAVNQDYLLNTFQGAESDPDISARLSVLVKVACQALIREADTTSLNHWRENKAKELERRQREERWRADTHYRQNTLLPIHTIPLEVFSGILTWIVKRKSLHHSYENHIFQIATLARVSRYWNQAILSTPQVWSYFKIGMTPTQILWSIARSKSIPVDIDFGDYDPTTDLVGFTQAIIPLSHRWHTLETTGVLPSEIIKRLESDTPELHHLSLQNLHVDAHFNLGKGPPLESLALHYVTLSWDSNRLCGLRSLKFMGDEETYAPSLSQITRILASSPRLEEFTFEYDGIRDVEEYFQPPTERIHLPNLAVMGFYHSDRCTLDHLLSFIQFPLLSCTTLQLQSTGTSNVSNPFHYSSDAFAEQVAHFTGTGDRASVKLYGHTVALTIGNNNISTDPRDPTARFRLILAAAEGGESLKDTIGELAELINKALPALPVHISLSQHMHCDFQVELFGMFPSATRITAPRGSFDSRPLLRYLSGQRHLNPFTGEEEWPCPRLAQLDLLSPQERQMTSVRRWVKARWVKWKVPAKRSRSETQIVEKPVGSVEVTMTMGQETWRPALAKVDAR